MPQLLFSTTIFCLTAILAMRIGRYEGNRWVLGFVMGTIILAIVNLLGLVPRLINTPLYGVMMSNNLDAVLLGVAGILAVIPCLPKLRQFRTRLLVISFLTVSLLRGALLPSTVFYLNRNELAGLAGRIDKNGVVIQTTDYTCGPAATATVLKEFGIHDTESNIALATGCNSYSGTRPLDIVNYLNRRYGNEIRAEYRYFNSVDSLIETEGFFIAEVRASRFNDHFVAVIKAGTDRIIVADPVLGRFESTPDNFAREWRNKAIMVTKR